MGSKIDRCPNLSKVDGKIVGIKVRWGSTDGFIVDGQSNSDRLVQN